MEQILVFIVGAGVGAVVVWIAMFLIRANKHKVRKKGLIEMQAEEKRRNIEAILGLMESGNQPLTNNHVEHMLGIADATAERYLQELEKEGKVRQVGKTGTDVYYERIDK